MKLILIPLLFFFPLCRGQEITSLIANNAKPELLADGFRFTEGPAADADGNIYFTDIGNNRVHHWDAVERKLSTVLENTGGADGLFVDREGRLWICELRKKRLSRINPDGTYEVVASSFEGEPFTGANDLWIDWHGGIYFSDSYGGSEVQKADHRVFYFSRDGELTLVADNFFKSNGLHGTADGRWLYIADYIENLVYKYQLLAPGKVGERSVFAEYRCDGMTLDEKGNVYLSTGNSGNGIVVMNPQGVELGKISIPENPANVCFGGPENKTLNITATHGLYSLKMNVRGNFSNSPQKAIFTDNGGLAPLLKQGAIPHLLGTGYRPAQGPATDKHGNVFFTDIYNNKIMKWSFEDNSISIFREQTGAPDGLYFEKDGSFLVCELTGLRFARLTPEGEYQIIAESFNGKALTGPNDVYVDSRGGIYFSDSYPGNKIREPEHCVYYIALGDTVLKKIIDDHYKTKGIHISADGEWIYIADYGGRKVYRYELLAPGVLGKKEVFIDTRCGGLTVDEMGNVYISTVDDYLGLLVYDRNGNRLGQIMFPEGTTNATFGGPENNVLMVTTLRSIYALEMNVRGLH